MENLQIHFGYKTALQILRAARPGQLTPIKGKTRALSNRAPTRSALAAALERVEATVTGLHLEQPAHILIGSTSRCRVRETCVPHVCSANLSDSSFCQLDEGIFVSTPALAFIQSATQEKSMYALLVLGYELCGSYQIGRADEGTTYQIPPLMSVCELRKYVARNPSIDGARKVARMLRYLADNSASPRETQLALTMGLPIMYGGYGLGIPCMNYEIKASNAARSISGRASFRCDLCWPNSKLDVEYQSREMHEGEVSRIKDSRRTNALVAMDWTVACVTNEELNSLAATDIIAQTLRRQLGIRTQIRKVDYHARKLKLRRQVGLPLQYE